MYICVISFIYLVVGVCKFPGSVSLYFSSDLEFFHHYFLNVFYVFSSLFYLSGAPIACHLKHSSLMLSSFFLPFFSFCASFWILSLACLHSLPPSLFLSLYSGRERKAGGQGWGDGGICFILSFFALHLGFISGQWGGEVVWENNLNYIIVFLRCDYTEAQGKDVTYIRVTQHLI